MMTDTRQGATHAKPRRRRSALFLVPLLIFGFMFFGLSYLVSPEPDVEIQSGIGLAIVDLHDGSKVSVTGLDGSAVTARWAYGYDEPNHRVMAMTADGSVFAIALDTASATRAEPQASGAWVQTLSAARQPVSPPNATAAEASFGTGERLKLRPQALGSVLVRVTADGPETVVGDTVFHRASLVVDGATAQRALISHARNVNDTSTMLSAVSLATGAVTGSVALDSPDRVVTLPNGTTVVASRSGLAAVGADGRVTALSVGASDFFGNPS
jgi:hypothetical protein